MGAGHIRCVPFWGLHSGQEFEIYKKIVSLVPSLSPWVTFWDVKHVL